MTRPAIPLVQVPFINDGEPFAYRSSPVRVGGVVVNRVSALITPADGNGNPGVSVGISGGTLGFLGQTPRTRPDALTVAIPVAVADVTGLTSPAASAAPVAYDQTQMGEVVTLLNEVRSKINDSIADMANACKSAINTNRNALEEVTSGLGDSSTGLGLLNTP